MTSIEVLVALALLCAILLVGERVRASLLSWRDVQYAWALRQTGLLYRLQWRLEGQEKVEVREEELPGLMARVIGQATGSPSGCVRFFDLRTEPPLAMTFNGDDDRCYTFTPRLDRAQGVHPRGRWFVVDALTTDPLTVAELAVAFETVLGMTLRTEEAREEIVVPRSDQWGLLVRQL